MNPSIKSQIEECEKRLRQAMLQSDLAALDALLAPDLIFTNHLGQVMTKADDLAAHQSGIVQINKIILSDQKLIENGNTTIVSAQAHIVGKFNGEGSDSTFRFTRVWRKTPDNTWQVIAGHSSSVIHA